MLARVVGHLSLLCSAVTLVGGAVTLVCRAITLVCRAVTHVGDPVALVGYPVALVRCPVALVPELLPVACRSTILRSSETPPRGARPLARRKVARLASFESFSALDRTAQTGVPSLRTRSYALNRICRDRLLRSVVLAGTTATHERIVFAARGTPTGTSGCAIFLPAVEGLAAAVGG